jgi:hypothetical protein
MSIICDEVINNSTVKHVSRLQNYSEEKGCGQESVSSKPFTNFIFQRGIVSIIRTVYFNWL